MFLGLLAVVVALAAVFCLIAVVFVARVEASQDAGEQFKLRQLQVVSARAHLEQQEALAREQEEVIQEAKANIEADKGADGTHPIVEVPAKAATAQPYRGEIPADNLAATAARMASALAQAPMGEGGASEQRAPGALGAMPLAFPRARSFGIVSLRSNYWVDRTRAGRAGALLSRAVGARASNAGAPFVAGGNFSAGPEAKMVALQKLQELQKIEPKEARAKEWRMLLRNWHPDKNPDNKDVATEVFQFLQKGKNLLNLQ
ncbi:unnamed protein product [Prorocentrum cordatum]|uniref:J domain-containing protein n=1 Tax=Prorocentrum cordatum TaxID=2364126 RepID=A0ABN9R6J4_9DINO|nr:unnamed protein product [Polarella glacialis]